MRFLLLSSLTLVLAVLGNNQNLALAKHSKSYKELKPAQLPNFDKAESTWFDRYVEEETKIPIGAFQAYYFDKNKPNKIMHREKLETLNLQYAWDLGPNSLIESENFGAYFVGRINVTSALELDMHITQGWSTTRVLIDGHVIFDGDFNHVESILLESGEHLIEVEHLNAWHATQLSMYFMKPHQ